MSVYVIPIVLLFARFYEKDLDRLMIGIISSLIICSQMKACLKKYVIIPRQPDGRKINSPLWDELWPMRQLFSAAK